ncbi:hypothetical protein BTO04_04565 [Polaribacter sp. SA4-10]|uniref:hypothetical protein n=1 Tax=Polaribacter sp. SA4-10 TaxID=754397 RepID=UPI000B3BEDA2|nr:hypothetical protein [Polaribacter sp. SA4-10]ARV06018.1 hypothetical protein BTO04_04565 [Polaribacter sp. SA4-10]
MNTLLRKSAFVVSILLATSSFISCNKTDPKPENEPVLLAEHSITPSEKMVETFTRKPVVFIAGIDKGDATFYADARLFFQEKEFEIINQQYSLEEIISWLNNNVSQVPFGEIHIVTKSNPFKGMDLETVINGQKVTAETLRKNITQGNLPALEEVVNPNSKIVFHASGLSENKELMKTLKDAFCNITIPKIVASPYHTVFGGEFSKHYLAKPYYVFYPTANSPGKTDLSKEISRKYLEEKEIDWFDALNNKEERYVGEAYTIQFNIPLKWEFDYHNSDDEIPTFTMQEEVMDWIEQQEELKLELSKYNVPIEKFRWNWSLKNSKLIIKGTTTVLCVLKPLIKPYGELQHIEPDTDNKRLYAMK